MNPALLTVKAIQNKADLFARDHTDVANGLAISLYQDSVELYLWTLIKKLNISVQERSGFVAYISALESSGSSVLYRNQLHELNTARVNFKHYGNFPAPSDVIKFGVVVSSFFSDSCERDFGVTFENISVTALIQNKEIRTALKNGEDSLASGDLKGAAEQLGIGLYLMTSALSGRIPRITTRNLFPRSGLSEHESNAQIGFENVENSLRAMRDLLVIGLNQIEFKTHLAAENYLPTTHRLISGKYTQNHNVWEYDQNKLARFHKHLVDSCIKTNL